MSTTLKKSELIAQVAEKTNATKADAERSINAIIEALEDALVKKQTVTFVGFGTFTTAERKARTGRNPRTGETMNLPASTTPKFRPSPKLKEAINK